MGGNAVRPVQWYGTSPITLRPGTVSIPRGGPPVSVDRLGIFWRVGLFSHSRLRAALHVIQSLRTPSYLLHTDSTVLRDGAIPPWMRVFLGGRDSRYHTPLRARLLRRVSASRRARPRVARCRYARARGSRKAIGTNVIETVQINVLHARAGPTRASRDPPVAGRASRPGHRGRDEI